MKYEKLTDTHGKCLYGVVISNEDGTSRTYTTMDIAYTLAQAYSEVLVGDLFYINRKFPLECLTFELSETDTDIASTMKNLDVDLYFNGDGVFLFKGESEPNALRATEEFIYFFKAGQVIRGPVCTSFTVSANEILVKRMPGDSYSVYMYQD